MTKLEIKTLLQFAKRMVFFLLFLLICCSFLLIPAGLLFVSGELAPIDQVIRQQINSSEDVLLGLAYSEPDAYFKLHATIERKPEVLILGTSRVLQFRDQFFKHPDTVYNAGRAIVNLKHFRLFINHLPKENQPKILIISMDQYFFNPNWEHLHQDDYEQRLTKSPNPLTIVQSNWLQVYKDVRIGKVSLSKVLNRPPTKIGMNAIMNGNGLRNDGSYLDFKFINDPDNPANNDYHFRETYQQIEQGSERFVYGDEISKESLEELRFLLQLCKQRNIHVIGFLPPYAHEVYEKMKQTGKYRYLNELNQDLSPIFEEYGAELYDYSDLRTVGANDTEVIDAYHPSEKAMLRLFILMTEKSLTLKEYAVDLQYLKEKLYARESNFQVFID